MTSGRLPDVTGARFRLRLDPGTVWVLARLLDPASPEGGYVGFNVISGTVILPAIPTIAGDRLTLAAPGPIDLSLTLAATTPSANAACSFGSITGPHTITITLSAPPTFSGMEGSVVLGGSTIQMAAGNGIGFDNTWSTIAFSCTPQPGRLDLASVTHAIAQFSGEARIERAAWAVPLTRPADPNTLGEADPAASGWLLHLGGGRYVLKYICPPCHNPLCRRGVSTCMRRSFPSTGPFRKLSRTNCWPTSPFSRPSGRNLGVHALTR